MTARTKTRQKIGAEERVTTLRHRVPLRYFGILLFVAMAIAVIAISPASPATHIADAQTLSVCDRTPQVRDAIVAFLVADDPAEGWTCTNADTGFPDLTELDVSNTGIRAFKARDFQGLEKVTSLNIADNHVTSLPSDSFDDLDDLETIDFSNNNITELGDDFFGNSFDGKATVTSINAYGNRITSIGERAFEDFDALAKLDLGRNDLTALTPGVFDDLAALVELNLASNDLETLPEGIFDKLTADGNACDLSPNPPTNRNDTLRILDLQRNELNSLPDGVFDCLRPLTSLYLNHNNLASLPDGILDRQENLAWLTLEHNELTELPDGLLDGTSLSVEHLDLSDNKLTSLDNLNLHDRSKLSSILELDISNNLLTKLPDAYVEEFANLSTNGVGQETDGYCLVQFFIGGNPISQEWIESGKYNEFLDYLGNYNPRGEGDCSVATRYPDSEAKRGDRFIFAGDDAGARSRARSRVVHQNVLGIEALDISGIDMSHTITGTNKTSWQLILERMADLRVIWYDSLYDFTFGWEGLVVDNAAWNQLPFALERIVIKDATISDNISSRPAQGFRKFDPERIDQFYNRIDKIAYKHNIDDEEEVAMDPAMRRRGSLYWGRWPIDTYEGYDTWFLDRGAGLQSLTLDNVGLTGDGGGVIAMLPNDLLRWLEIRNNPELTEIHPHISTLRNLYGLQIENNGITTVPENAFMGALSNKLFYLGLGGNKITSIDAGAFNGLDEVHMLMLHDNELSYMDGDDLTGLKKLENLYLQNNDLLYLPEEFFAAVDRSGSTERLEQLNLEGNPGTPFHFNVNLENHPADGSKKRVNILAGAPYQFDLDVLNMDGSVEETVIVDDGTLTVDVDFPTDGSIGFLPRNPNHANADNRYCLGIDECYAGFELKKDPAPRLMVVELTSGVKHYEVGEMLTFRARFSEDIVVGGTPLLTFLVGEEMEERRARYAGQTFANVLTFDYTVEELDMGLTGLDASGSTIENAVLRGEEDRQTAVDSVQGTVLPLPGVAFVGERPEPPDPVAPVVSTAEISRIVPTIRGVTLRGGERVRLGIDAYGLQNIIDNSLLDDADIDWNDRGGGGRFDGDGSRVTYTAPSAPGTYRLVAALGSRDCEENPNTEVTECTANFEVTVRRDSGRGPGGGGRPETALPPVNPPGDIPSTLTDNRGNIYNVFTPEEGGNFDGDGGLGITAEPGDVPNGEFIGIRITKGGPASNLGMTHHRYTLGGNLYNVHVVDSNGTVLDDYLLDSPARVCIPLPTALRNSISTVALVAVNSDESLTILSGAPLINVSGDPVVCGNLGRLPATVAVGTQGAPGEVPTPVPTPEPEIPDTGATAPSSQGTLWLMLLGITLATLAVGVLFAARRRKLN